MTALCTSQDDDLICEGWNTVINSAIGLVTTANTAYGHVIKMFISWLVVITMVIILFL